MYFVYLTENFLPAFHNGLPKCLSDELERIQKRAMQIIFPNIKYQDALKTCNLCSSYERREYLTNKLFEEICSDPNHKLHYLVPKLNETDIGLRNRRMFNFLMCKTHRLKNSLYLVIHEVGELFNVSLYSFCILHVKLAYRYFNHF